MIKLPNWLARLRPTPRNKPVPFSPDPPSPAFRSRIMSYAEAMEGHKQELAQLKRLQSSAPSSKPEPMAYRAGEIAATVPKPSGSRLFIGGIEQPQPTGSETLLKMVGYAIAEEPWEDEAKGAVLAVARWLHAQDCGHTARLLEREGSE